MSIRKVCGANNYNSGKSIQGMVNGDTAPAIDDIAYLARARHRIPTLLALTVRPRS